MSDLAIYRFELVQVLTYLTDCLGNVCGEGRQEAEGGGGGGGDPAAGLCRIQQSKVVFLVHPVGIPLGGREGGREGRKEGRKEGRWSRERRREGG